MHKIVVVPILLFLCVSFGQADQEHGETREHQYHMSSTRVSRWHVHNKMAVPVQDIRADCMGSQLRIIDISLIMSGSLCHINASRVYVDRLATEIEACSMDDDCHQVSWNSAQLDTTDCITFQHNYVDFCTGYLQQYRTQCLQFFNYELLYTNMITALDIELECVSKERLKVEYGVEYSVETLLDKQPINLGHLITKCKSLDKNKYLHIAGFVETAEKCPADNYRYSPPYAHPLVKVLQEHADKGSPIVNYEDYHQKLSLRLICGNIVFPVVYDGMISLSKAHSWIYYKCGEINDSFYTWNGHWLNLTRELFNGTHTVKIDASLHNHCSVGHKMTVMFLLAMLVLAISCEVFTLYRRDEMLDYVHKKKKATKRKLRVQHQAPTTASNHQKPDVALTDVELSPKTSLTSLNSITSKQLLLTPIRTPTVALGNRNDNASCSHQPTTSENRNAVASGSRQPIMAENRNVGASQARQPESARNETTNESWTSQSMVHGNRYPTPNGSHQSGNNNDVANCTWQPESVGDSTTSMAWTRQPKTDGCRKTDTTRKCKSKIIQYV